MGIDRDSFHRTAEQYLKLWSCEVSEEPFFTSSSLLWPAKRNGKDIILKVADPEDDEAHSSAALEFFSGNGSVKLMEHEGHVVLLERINPSDPYMLERMVLEGHDDKATEIICDVIEKLHSVSMSKPGPVTAIPFRQRSLSLRTHVDQRKIKAEDYLLFRLAYDLLDELINETVGTEIFLHGDIHHFNILHSPDRGWLAIDPKGIKGPRVYEYVNSLCNPYMHESIVANAGRMSRQASIISEIGNVDRDLLMHFTFLHAMQAASWSLVEPDKGYWLSCARVAAKLAGLKVP